MRLAGWLIVIPPVILALVPIAMLLAGSLRDAPPGAAGHWTFGNYAALFSSARLLAVLFNTVWVALFATVLAIAAGTAMAWVVARTDIPGRRVLEALAIVPFLTPGIVTAIGWGILANPDNGLLNTAWHTRWTHSSVHAVEHLQPTSAWQSRGAGVSGVGLHLSHDARADAQLQLIVRRSRATRGCRRAAHVPLDPVAVDLARARTGRRAGISARVRGVRGSGGARHAGRRDHPH